MSSHVTKTKLLVATSVLAIGSMALAPAARADSLADLKLEMKIIQSQLKDLQVKEHTLSPAKRDELAEVKAEVAQLKSQMDERTRIEAQAKPASPAPGRPATYEQQLAANLQPQTNNQGISFNGGTTPLGPDVQKPIVGGIPLITTPGGAFFIAGTIDAGLRDDIGAGHSVVSVQSGLMRASRLTFEGYQNVGFGLRAVGVIEGGLNVAEGIGASNPSTAGNGFDFGRESFAGIGNDTLGYIDFGRQYSPIWAVSAAPTADPFAGNYLGGIVAFDPTLAVNSRVSNAITYNYRYTWEGMLDPSPSRGFGFAALYAPGGGNGTTVNGVKIPVNSGQSFGASASYGTAKWWIGAGYDQIDGYNANVAPYSQNYVPSTALKTALREETVAASYLTPIARLFVQYNAQSDGRKNASFNPANNTRNDGVDQDDWFVGFVAPTFPHQNLRFTYGQFYDHTTQQAEYSMYQASYEYDLVRVPGTALYAEALVVDNNKHSAQGVLGAGNVLTTPGPGAILPDQLTANGTTPDYGATSTSLAVGVRFIF